ncbi:hypothetical protein GCM10010169_21490 [Micromonospora fulviviridis]|uniref:hypothetical protein n=1 Tax=Micromonospora fulviviridis TaxID=47860 RepID=UPI0016674DA0|nr:hypothetical protein [Micromonospora fulviviridis]GGR76997.1 hypothetical protein GCM10010169_21490 [Micromonospora fulviviridis]
MLAHNDDPGCTTADEACGQQLPPMKTGKDGLLIRRSATPYRRLAARPAPGATGICRPRLAG